MDGLKENRQFTHHIKTAQKNKIDTNTYISKGDKSKG
jgi:hypothetical protein